VPSILDMNKEIHKTKFPTVGRHLLVAEVKLLCSGDDSEVMVYWWCWRNSVDEVIVCWWCWRCSGVEILV